MTKTITILSMMLLLTSVSFGQTDTLVKEHRFGYQILWPKSDQNITECTFGQRNSESTTVYYSYWFWLNNKSGFGIITDSTFKKLKAIKIEGDADTVMQTVGRFCAIGYQVSGILLRGTRKATIYFDNKKYQVTIKEIK